MLIGLMVGFELQGPSKRQCGINGAWNQADSIIRCVDVTPPQITCPANLTLPTELNENYGNIFF